MAPSARLRLAIDFAEELRRKEGRNLVAVALYGSVASGTEHAHSDVDLLVIARRNKERPAALMRRGYLVTLKAMTPEEAEGEVTGPHLALPEILGGWRSMRPLYDPTGLVRRLVARSRRVPASQFRNAARRGLLAVYEDLGKLRDAIETGDRARTREMAIWYTGGVTCLAFLLDRKVIPSGKEMFVEVRQLGAFGRAITALRYDRLSAADTSRLAESSWSSLRRKAARQGIATGRLP